METTDPMSDRELNVTEWIDRALELSIWVSQIKKKKRLASLGVQTNTKKCQYQQQRVC